MSPESQFVLVTGGTGFLGSHIVQQLLDGGYKVRCTARPLKSRFLEAAHLGSVRSGQLEVVEINDLASENLEQILANITAVIHTAFPVPGSMDNTELLLNATSSTTSLLRQAYEHGIRRFVLTSSYLAMVGLDNRDDEGAGSSGVWSDYVFDDQDWTHATYESVFTGKHDPAWAYAAAKTLAEAAAWDFVSTRPDFDLATVLPTLLLGPFSPGHAILSTSDLSTNVMLHSLLTSGTPPHPVWPHFVDVRDAALAHVKALEAPRLNGYSSVTSILTSQSSKSGQRAEPGQPSGQPPRSGQAHLTSLSQSSNPSLVDLGTTLHDLETNFQTTLEPSSSQLLLTTSQSLTAQAQHSTTPHASDAADSRYPTSSIYTTSSSTTMVQPRAIPRKRFIATGASFTWSDAISHLRTARPDLSDSLADERACLPMPEMVAGVEWAWSGAAWASAVGLRMEGERAGGSGVAWTGLDIQWRDWRKTVEDAVRDLKRVAGGLEKSGWEDLFGGDEDDEEDDEYTRQAKEDGQETGS